MSAIKADSRPKFERDVSVFSTVDPRLKKEKGRHKDTLTEEDQTVVNGYKIKLFKLAYNRFPSYRNEGDRVRALDDFVTKLKTGWPWKNNQRLTLLGTPQLVSFGEALSKRIVDVEKCKKRGNRTDTGTYN